MTKKLEALFGIDDDVDNDETIVPEQEEILEHLITTETLETIEKIENALPQVRGLESSDQEMDELGSLAKEAFNTLLDLGMQVDSRFSAEIFNSASSMLGHAITTKTAKINKKLKMIDLQLKKAELERKLSQTSSKTTEDTPIANASVVDRNDLIKQFLAQSLEDNKKDK